MLLRSRPGGPHFGGRRGPSCADQPTARGGPPTWSPERTTTFHSRPRLSTGYGLLRPVTFVAASKPYGSSAGPFWTAVALWPLMIALVGLAPGPRARAWRH